MKIVTGKQMKRLDQKTIESGTTGEILMERAGGGAFVEILEFLKSIDSSFVTRTSSGTKSKPVNSSPLPNTNDP